jgi:hypothetical protein
MLSQSFNNTGTPFFPSIAKDSTLSKVLEVVECCLLGFPEKCWQTMFNRDNTLTPDNVDETDFNTELSHHLSLEFAFFSLSGQFTVRPEYPENRSQASHSKKGLRRQIDLAVRSANGKRILAIEGKRLHDPNDKQYVRGNTGGIARFKREDHGKELGFACMVGYVQQETFAFWHKKVNQWISNEMSTVGNTISWDESDLLSTPESRSECLVACQSIHLRLKEAPIALTHYWVSMVHLR